MAVGCKWALAILDFVLSRNSKLDSVFSWFIAVCACFYVTFTSGFFLTSGVLFVLIQDRYDVNKQRASYPINGLTSSQSIFGFLSGPILHRLKTRKTLMLSVGLGILGSCLAVKSPFEDTISWLTFCMAIRGFGSSLSYPVIIQAISSHFTRHRGKAFMVLSLFIPLGGLVLPSTVRVSAEEYGLESSWFIHAAFYAQVLLLAFIIKPRDAVQPIIEKETQQELESFIKNETPPAERQDTKSTQTLTDLFKGLLLDKAFHVLWLAHLIIMLSNISFRTTIVDYGRDTNLNPSLNKYILEMMSFCDIIRIPTAMAIDKRFAFEETILTFATVVASMSLLILTQTSGGLYVMAVCLYSTCYAVSASVIYPIFATLGTARLALSFGLAMAVYGLVQLALPSLIGFFRDVHGSYDYLFYTFASLNIVLAFVLGLSRTRRWFNHQD